MGTLLLDEQEGSVKMGRKPKVSEKQLEEILKSSPYMMNNKKTIMEEYHVSDKTAERIMKKLGLIQTSDKNIECIVRYLNGERNKDLIEEYEMSQVNFNALLRFRNIEPRYTQYFFNHKYFNNIDSEDKAYFLGFIYADGNLFRNSLKISIRDYDVDVLKKMKHYINSNHRIYTKPLAGFSAGRESENGYLSELILTHRKLPDQLAQHGIVPNKTHKISKLPSTVPEKLIKHFMRGYIDGDGTFGKYTHNDGCERYSLQIIGTADFLTDFRIKAETLSENYFHDRLYDRHPERKTNTRSLTMAGKANVISFLNWLYEDSNIWMNRKYNNYKDIIM